MKKTAWHYTALSNFLSIVHDDELRPYPLADKWPWLKTPAICLWPTRLYREAHMGSIMWQVSQKCEWDVVLLQVEIDEKYVIAAHNARKYTNQNLERGATLTVYHDGELGKIKYHDHVPMWLYVKPIPLRSIVLERRYNLWQLLHS